VNDNFSQRIITEQENPKPKRFIVLLLDDEPDVTAVLKKGLEVLGPFEVHAFNDPEEALKSVRDTNYHIMIIDLKMQKMNGFEFYEKAQGIDQGSATVVFITALNSYYDEYKARYPKLNGNCFIVKPISISTLVQFLLNELS
jgi:CheY-like chemotaxis protein